MKEILLFPIVAIMSITFPIVDSYKNIHFLPIIVNANGVNHTFNMGLDMNTDIMWVPSSSCNAINFLSTELFNSEDHFTYVYQRGSVWAYRELEASNITLYFDDTTHYSSANISLANMCYNLKDLPCDGILGMSLYGYQSKYTSNFLYMLKQNKVISNAIVGLYLNGSMQNLSSMTIDGFDSSKVLNPIVWIKTQNDGEWSMMMKKMIINSQDVLVSAERVVIDIGSSNIVVPYEDGTKLLAKITEGKKCEISPYYSTVYCVLPTANYSEFPTLQMILEGEIELNLTSKEYVNMVPLADGTYVAQILIEFASISHWSLGSVFMREFYLILNYENSSIGISPYDVVIIIKPSFWTIWVILGIVGIGVAVILACLIIYFCVIRRKKRNTESEEKEALRSRS